MFERRERFSRRINIFFFRIHIWRPLHLDEARIANIASQFHGKAWICKCNAHAFHDEHLKSGKSRGKSNLVCITSAAVSIHVHMSNLAILTFAKMMLVMMQQTPARVRRRLGTRTTRQARPSTFNQHLQYNSLTPPIQLLFTKGSFHLIIILNRISNLHKAFHDR